MKKRTIAIITCMILAVSTAFGQIIFTEEDQYGNNRTTGDGFDVMVPMQNVNIDQYQQNLVPLGSGLLILAGLGGAYLLKKKEENSKQ